MKKLLIIIVLLILFSLFAGCIYVNPWYRLERKKELLTRLPLFRTARFPVKIILSICY